MMYKSQLRQFMIRTQIQLSEAQAETLKRLAQQRRVSIAELIRKSIDLYLKSTGKEHPSEQKARAKAIAGQFSSCAHDIARQHDKHLADIYGK